MADKEPKSLTKSLTVQSSVALGVLIILKAVLPVYTGYEIPDELFESLCGLLGISLTVGLRRALPVVILCMLPLSSINCGPVLCDNARVAISKHPSLASPAGVVKVTCDGDLKAEIKAKNVPKVKCEGADSNAE